MDTQHKGKGELMEFLSDYGIIIGVASVMAAYFIYTKLIK